MTKHKRDRSRDRHDKGSSSSRKKVKREKKPANDEDEWEESNVDIANAASTSTVAAPVKPAIEREEWMRDPSARPSKLSHGDDLTDGYGDEPARAPGQDLDFFSGLGTEHRRKEKPLAPDPASVCFLSTR